MLKILRRVPLPTVLLALAFLLVQVFASLYLPYLTAGIVNEGILNEDLSFIWRQGGLMIGLSLISLVGAILNTYFASKVSEGVGRDLRQAIFTKVLSFSKKEYNEVGAASLITRNINDVRQVQDLVGMLLKFLVLAPLYLSGGILLTYLLSPKLAWIFIAVLPILTIAAISIRRWANPLYSYMQRVLDQLNLIFREGLTGVKVIRAFNRQQFESQRYEVENNNYQATAVKAGTIMSLFLPLISLVMNLVILVVIWQGGHEVAASRMEVGTIIAVINYGGQILIGFGILTQVILAVPRGQVSAKRINQILALPVSLTNGSNDFTKQQTTESELSFKEVDFSYPQAGKESLTKLNFTVKQGETLALIGGTGAGKTSIVNLISRMYDPTGGKLTLNGQELQKYEQKALNSQISLTPQKSQLFSGTIRSNLLLAKADASEAEMWQVLKIAQAEEFVLASGKGLDYQVEQGGTNFSGGQRQRLCIARALLKEGIVYIFDDSFSALDFKTDRLVRQGLKTRLADKISLIVAQRINTIIEADQILVIDNGEIIARGNHEELLKESEFYQEIVRSQLEEGEVA